MLSLKEDLTVLTGNIFVKGPDLLASLNKKSGFEIFDFGIVLGRLILAGTFLGLLDLSRDFLGGGGIHT